jgi:hypothetical protein
VVSACLLRPTSLDSISLETEKDRLTHAIVTRPFRKRVLANEFRFELVAALEIGGRQALASATAAGNGYVAKKDNSPLEFFRGRDSLREFEFFTLIDAQRAASETFVLRLGKTCRDPCNPISRLADAHRCSCSKKYVPPIYLGTASF